MRQIPQTEDENEKYRSMSEDLRDIFDEKTDDDVSVRVCEDEYSWVTELTIHTESPSVLEGLRDVFVTEYIDLTDISVDDRGDVRIVVDPFQSHVSDIEE